MEGNGVIKDFPGNYSDYREYLREQKANEEQKAAQKCEAQTKSRSRENSRSAKMSFKERKEFEELTAEIDRLTAERHELETVFNSGEQLSDIEEKARRYSELKDLLDEKEMRWLELSEKRKSGYADILTGQTDEFYGLYRSGLKKSAMSRACSSAITAGGCQDSIPQPWHNLPSLRICHPCAT